MDMQGAMIGTVVPKRCAGYGNSIGCRGTRTASPEMVNGRVVGEVRLSNGEGRYHVVYEDGDESFLPEEEVYLSLLTPTPRPHSRHQHDCSPFVGHNNIARDATPMASHRHGVPDPELRLWEAATEHVRKTSGMMPLPPPDYPPQDALPNVPRRSMPSVMESVWQWGRNISFQVPDAPRRSDPRRTLSQGPMPPREAPAFDIRQIGFRQPHLTGGPIHAGAQEVSVARGLLVLLMILLPALSLNKAVEMLML